MKNLNYIILSIALLSILSCGKQEKVCCGAQPSSQLTVQRNDVSYRTPDIHGTTSGDSITFTYAGQVSNNTTSLTLDSLFIRLKYNGIGTYSLANAHAAYFVITSTSYPAPANSPTVSYQLNGSYNNTLTITGYDQNTGKMTATFNMQFSNSPASTINLLNGNFYLLVNY